jgi:hypothetical protein
MNFDFETAFHFETRFPKNVDDLHACFTMLEHSTHYDGQMKREEIIDAWASLLTDGIGYIDMPVPSNFDYRNQGKTREQYPYPLDVFCFHFSVFITEEYAEGIAPMLRNNRTTSLVMDFLSKYYNHKKHGLGKNPAHTKATLEEEATKAEKDAKEEKDTGLYLLAIGVPNRNIFPVNALQPRAKLNYAIWSRDITKRLFGGFSYQGWFVEISGDEFRDGLVSGAGYAVLHSYLENENMIKNPDEKRYVLCKTRDKNVFDRLKIDENKAGVIKDYEWFEEIFQADKRIADMSVSQQQVAYLLTLDFETEDIRQFLYHASDSSLRGPNGYYSQIGRKLKLAGYISKETKCTQKRLKEVLLKNQHEIRPVIVPLYPDPRT